jgi:hypothetical protein
LRAIGPGGALFLWQWAMGNGQWAMGNGQSAIGNWQSAAGLNAMFGQA